MKTSTDQNNLKIGKKISREESLSINSKTSQERKETSNDQSRIRADHEYQKMIRRVLDEVFPD